MQDKEKKKVIVCIMGKSGSGKSTLINDTHKLYPMFNVIKSYTTRKPRENDPEDINTHIFVSEEVYELHRKHDKIIAEYHSDKSYTNWTSSDLFKDGINLYAIDPIACIKFIKKYKDKFIIVPIYNYISDIIRLKRLQQRDNIQELPLEEHLDFKHLGLNNISFNSLYNYENERKLNVMRLMEHVTGWLAEYYELDFQE